MLPVVKKLCVLTPQVWCQIHSACVQVPPVVKDAVHAEPLTAIGCRKQMASLALYLAKRRPISFPTKNVRTCLPLHSCQLCKEVPHCIRR